MNAFNLSSARIGEALPTLQIPPLTRHTLALYCGGSGDHVDVHTDSDAASAAGLGDVIGHGMLTMAWLGRLLTDIADPRAVRHFEARFLVPTRIGDAITCCGTVGVRGLVDGEDQLTLHLVALRADGVSVAEGCAIIAVRQVR
ncbi:MAG: MaoC/PaaZ C-terminal domain-containing protein [Sphingomonas sp.]|jgi:acyl dehydratase